MRYFSLRFCLLSPSSLDESYLRHELHGRMPPSPAPTPFTFWAKMEGKKNYNFIVENTDLITNAIPRLILQNMLLGLIFKLLKSV